MTAVFHARLYGRFMETYSNLRRNFMEQIKAPIFFETVLAIEIMSELPSNFAEKTTPAS